MFDFTTETILNDLTRVGIVDDTQDASLAVGEKALNVKRLKKFRPAEVKSIYKSAGYAAVNEVAHVTVPTSVTAGDVYRVNIDCLLLGSQDAEYTRWAVNKGKPFLAEYLVLATSATVDTHGPLIATSINNALKKQGFSDVVVSYNATSDKIEITATNEYQRFAAVYIEKYNTVTFEFDIVQTGTIKTIGKEGFGTSWFLTKNIRLPTVENMRFMGEFQDELPIANSLYTQYSITIENLRNITGQGAVGQRMTSKTVHIFYVLSTLVSSFEASIATVFGSSAIIDAISGAPTAFSALSDIVFQASTVSAAAAVANTYVGSLTSYLADLSLANGVTYSLVSGAGSTDNASFVVSGATIRVATTVTAGTKAIRVRATNSNGTYEEAISVVISA